MLNTIIYSQRDKRWAGVMLGFRNPITKRYVTIGSHGCTITCLASLLTYMGHPETPLTVNQKLKKRNGFSGAYVIWSKVAEEWPKVKYVKRGYNYSELDVSWYVYMKRIPVVVEVNGAKIGASRHWVLFIGDRYMIDPWFGKRLPTNTYPTTGYALFDRR